MMMVIQKMMRRRTLAADLLRFFFGRGVRAPATRLHLTSFRLPLRALRYLALRPFVFKTVSL